MEKKRKIEAIEEKLKVVSLNTGFKAGIAWLYRICLICAILFTLAATSCKETPVGEEAPVDENKPAPFGGIPATEDIICLLYTSDAADE